MTHRIGIFLAAGTGYGLVMTVRRAGALTASAALFGLAGLHAAWGAGCAWPAADRRALADAVIGTKARTGSGTGSGSGTKAGTGTGTGTGLQDSGMPGPAACFAVSGALVTAGALVAGWPARRWPRLHRLGTCGVAGVLASRGALGLTGQTRVISPASESGRFLRLDRRVYSPACLALAALSTLALPRRASAATALGATAPPAG
jgi:hypothetical protein